MRFNINDNLSEFRFYQCPADLFTNANYKSLSNDTKILYMLMYDTNKLSISNNWIDDEGNFYIYFSLERICSLLNIGTTKAVNLKKELSKRGMIEEKRQGLNKPNKIYVNRLIYDNENSGLSENENHGLSENETPDFQKMKPNNNEFNNNEFNNNIYVEPAAKNNTSTEIENEIFDLYNSIAELPKVLKKTPKRKKAINARLRENNIDTVKKVLSLVSESKFLLGKVNNWKCDFDWIFNPNNFAKILEGKYNDIGTEQNKVDNAAAKEDIKPAWADWD